MVVNVDTTTVCLFHNAVFVCCIHIDELQEHLPHQQSSFSATVCYKITNKAAGTSNIISVLPLFVDIFKQIVRRSSSHRYQEAIMTETDCF